MRKLLFSLLILIVACCGSRAQLPQSLPAAPPQTEVRAGESEDNFVVAPSMLQAPSGKSIVLIRFIGPISDKSVSEILRAIGAAQKAEADAIVLDINSPGGYVAEGTVLAQAIEAVDTPVTCLVDGQGLSMALAVLQSCDHRVMTRRSILMAHQPNLGGRVNPEEHLNYYDQGVAMWHALAEQYARKAHVTADEFLKRTANGREWWMDWREALRVGMVDEVVSGLGDVIVKVATAG